MPELVRRPVSKASAGAKSMEVTGEVVRIDRRALVDREDEIQLGPWTQSSFFTASLGNASDID